MICARAAAAALCLFGLAGCAQPGPPAAPPPQSCPTVTPRLDVARRHGDVLLDCNGARVSIQTYYYIHHPGDNYDALVDERREDRFAPTVPAPVTPVSHPQCRPHNGTAAATHWVHTEVVLIDTGNGTPIVRESPRSSSACW